MNPIPDPDYIPWPVGLAIFLLMLTVPNLLLWAVAGWVGPALFFGLLTLLYVVVFGTLAVQNIKAGRKWSSGL